MFSWLFIVRTFQPLYQPNKQTYTFTWTLRSKPFHHTESHALTIQLHTNEITSFLRHTFNQTNCLTSWVKPAITAHKEMKHWSKKHGKNVPTNKFPQWLILDLSAPLTMTSVTIRDTQQKLISDLCWCRSQMDCIWETYSLRSVGNLPL